MVAVGLATGFQYPPQLTLRVCGVVRYVRALGPAMQWIASAAKDAATVTLEKRLWDAADQLRANSGLTSAQYGQPVLGLIFLRFAATTASTPWRRTSSTTSSVERAWGRC
jgi:hypothetical protein